MKYGFVIDNRKCIGCHACTVACKSEHDVAIGVNRTWVKQIEKGTFPNTRRVFSVMRCNHCTDAPCVEICPTEALHIREDGIVDFNNDRCIGCKSCMQACPYDSLYIDPDTKTAAKCNYCAHRVDVGLEPACVVVCPEEAIVSGDMDNPDSKISKLLSRQQVTVRKPEKATKPNLFYIDGDETSLNPSITDRSDHYIWNSQKGGVGHFSKFATDASKGKSYEEMAAKLAGDKSDHKPIEAILGTTTTKRVYDTPDKGILWGWEVTGYVLTKAISAGTFIIYFLMNMLGYSFTDTQTYVVGVVSLVFLGLTGILLVMDLDQPKRFLYVILRPQWRSWLVRGGYFITIFGGSVTLWLVSVYFDWNTLSTIAQYISAILAVFVAVYTAFLFAQARGRDFWQSPVLGIHMILHSIIAGTTTFYLMDTGYEETLNLIFYSVLGANLVTLLFELFTPHPTEDSRRVAYMIIKGRYSRPFWGGVVILGILLPVYLVTISFLVPATLFAIIGVYINNKIWIEAPQRIPLT